MQYSYSTVITEGFDLLLDILRPFAYLIFLGMSKHAHKK